MLLLDPVNNIYLVKTLYGILMLLPQGKAFSALNKRIKNIDMLMMMDSNKIVKISSSETNITNTSKEKKSDIELYLKEFDKVQLLKKSN